MNQSDGVAVRLVPSAPAHRSGASPVALPTTYPLELVLRTGFEVELLAPPGSSRQTLAEELARCTGGAVARTFHLDSEPSLVAGMGRFLHLTPAFVVTDAAGSPVCSLVDDVTITADLDRGAVPAAGWYRLLGDELRLLRLVRASCDPNQPLETVLDPVAAAFGTRVSRHGQIVRVDDASGATVALGAPLPGGRERPCEIVTPPLESDHLAALDRLLGPAARLGFAVPAEAAVHVHVDAAPFRTPHAALNLVRLFGERRTALHDLLGTNPRCTRLAPLPPALVALARDPDRTSRWEDVRVRAHATAPTKFTDLNLRTLFDPHPERAAQDTVEVRILAPSCDATAVMARAILVERLLLRCLDDTPVPRPDATSPEAAVEGLLDLAG